MQHIFHPAGSLLGTTPVQYPSQPPSCPFPLNDGRPLAPVADPMRRSIRPGTGRRGWRAAALAAALGLSACVPSGHLAREQTPLPTFDPIAFFAGSTEGRGSIAIVLGGRKPTLVEGHGSVAPDGSIDLNQVVHEGDKPPTRRSWHLYRVAPGRYAGTLSDATGPVAGDVIGNRLNLRFAMKGGLRAEQYLYLQPGGQVAKNRMVVTKLGIPVASLDETITRRPA